MQNGLRIFRNGVFRYINILLWLIAILFIHVTVYAEDYDGVDSSNDPYEYGTVLQGDDSEWGERLVNTYSFTLDESQLEELHFVTHTNDSLRVKVRDSDEYLVLDTYLNPLDSPQDFSLYLYPGDYFIEVFATSSNTSGDYKFKLTGRSLLVPPVDAYCDEEYGGFFKSKEDGEKEIHRINLYTSGDTSNIILWSDTSMEWTIRDSDEKILRTLYTQKNEKANEELLLQSGSYILEIDSYNCAGSYSFMIQSKNDYNEMQEGDDYNDGYYIEEDEGSELENIENNDSTEQDDDSDRYVSNVGDSEEESGGITSWLLENVFTPRTFIGAIVIAVIAGLIVNWLSK